MSDLKIFPECFSGPLTVELNAITVTHTIKSSIANVNC